MGAPVAIARMTVVTATGESPFDARAFDIAAYSTHDRAYRPADQSAADATDHAVPKSLLRARDRGGKT